MVNSEEDLLPVGKLPGEVLARLIGTYATTDPTVVVGPGVGGDAAAIDLGETTLVVKTDPITFATENAARYLVNINANDLACLGATARWMMITALLPEGETTEAVVESHFRELRDACLERDISLIGGHTEITFGLARPILVGVLMGEVAADDLLRPGGARPGDQLLLSKALAIEGTALLARELGPRLSVSLGPALIQRAANLLYDPGISVVLDAMILLRAGGVTALHDPTEGGLATGVGELALAAGCGATIDQDAVPILPETARIAAHLGLDPLGMLASGSLLTAADPASVGSLIAAGAAAGIPVTRIGAVTDQPGRLTLRAGNTERELTVYPSDEVTRVL
jgi:hydrogenase expression/formation protein HypE